MTVTELIEKLQKFPKDKDVGFCCPDEMSGIADIKTVEIFDNTVVLCDE